MNDLDRSTTSHTIDDSIYAMRTGGRFPSGGIHQLATVYVSMLLLMFTAIGGVALATLV